MTALPAHSSGAQSCTSKPNSSLIPVDRAGVGFTKQFKNGRIHEGFAQISEFRVSQKPVSQPMVMVPQTLNQKMWGYGASLTESCLENIKRLDKAGQTQLLKRAFSNQQGAGFSFVRIPLGSSDFSLQPYTLAETDDGRPDPDLATYNFSQLEQILEPLREIRAINPDVKLVLSPWTAPKWMKSPSGFNGGRLKREFFGPYARYLIRSVEEFEKRGVPVDYLTILNEPWIDHATDYPTMQMSTLEQKEFLLDHFLPELKRAKAKQNLKVQILVGDHNWEHVREIKKLLDDPKIRSASAGVAFHCYGGSDATAASTLKSHANVPIFMTECSALLSHNRFDDFKFWSSHFVIEGTQKRLTGALGWNLCLNESGGPHIGGGCKDCRGLITIKQDKTLEFAPEFHALEMASRHIKPGSRQFNVQTKGAKDLQSTAFLNPDGGRVLITRNDSQEEKSITIQNEACETAELRIPAQAAASIYWKAAPVSPTPQLAQEQQKDKAPKGRQPATATEASQAPARR